MNREDERIACETDVSYDDSESKEDTDVPEASFTVHSYGEDSTESASSEMYVCEPS